MPLKKKPNKTKMVVPVTIPSMIEINMVEKRYALIGILNIAKYLQLTSYRRRKWNERPVFKSFVIMT